MQTYYLGCGKLYNQLWHIHVYASLSNVFRYGMNRLTFLGPTFLLLGYNYWPNVAKVELLFIFVSADRYR